MGVWFGDGVARVGDGGVGVGEGWEVGLGFMDGVGYI